MAVLPLRSCGDSCRCNDEPTTVDDASNVYETFEKPIRVIDIRKTLKEEKGIHFLKPESWDFHVLSHTWSSVVRIFSKNIGHKIEGFTTQDKDAYNKAFEKETFDEDPTCYKQLLEIFEMLHADGVDLLWFDALCINQTSKDEKSFEINNMGSYFSLSIGTYVLTQGVGNVNGIHTEKVSNEDGVDFLPRCFTRVWTFQEFLLPKQLSFLVEVGIDQKFMAMINCLIKEKKRDGFCKCFLNMKNEELDEILTRYFKKEDLMWMGGFELRSPKWKSVHQLIKERAPHQHKSKRNWSFGPTHYDYLDVCQKDDNKTDKMYQRDILRELKQRSDQSHSNKLEALQSVEFGKSIISSEKICEDCGSKPMIRQAKHLLCHEEMTYFVDREVFLGLMQCHSRMVEKEPQEKLVPSKGIQALRGLYCAWATEGNWRPCHVICEVGWRDCKEQEDRVLAILGLLGLRLTQLRTGKTLAYQILELAKAGGSAMLVELCIMNQKAGSLPNMSWAPNFAGHNFKLEHVSRPRHVSVLIDGFGCDGQLKVKVKMACGRVEPRFTNLTRGCQSFEYHLILHNTIYDNQNCATKWCLSLAKDNQEDNLKKILHFEFSQDERMQLCGAFEVPININHKLDGHVSFSVCLLLLGKDEIGRSLFLVCIPDKFSSCENKSYENLHKIGCLAIENMTASLQSTFDSTKLHSCTIGGFGDDLFEYVQFH